MKMMVMRLSKMTRTNLIPKFIQILLLLLASPLLSKVLCIKECTNSPTQTELTSHTVRAQLSEDEVRALHEKSHSHLYLTPTDETTWINLMPRRLLHTSSDVEEFDWLMLYRSIKDPHARFTRKEGGDFLSEVSLHDVWLASDSIYWRVQQTNLEYLLLLDVDRLVWSFRKQAGLETPGTPYGGWEAANVELWGHFVAGGTDKDQHRYSTMLPCKKNNEIGTKKKGREEGGVRKRKRRRSTSF